jgi:hypothetical protein
VIHENRAKDHRSFDWFREGNSREKDRPQVNFVNDELASDDDGEICVIEWVDKPKDRLIPCPFLKPNSAERRGEIHIQRFQV